MQKLLEKWSISRPGKNLGNFEFAVSLENLYLLKITKPFQLQRLISLGFDFSREIRQKPLIDGHSVLPIVEVRKKFADVFSTNEGSKFATSSTLAGLQKVGNFFPVKRHQIEHAKIS